MRLPYETPKITVVGSVKDLTQGIRLTSNADNILPGVTIPVGGPRPPLS